MKKCFICHTIVCLSCKYISNNAKLHPHITKLYQTRNVTKTLKHTSCDILVSPETYHFFYLKLVPTLWSKLIFVVLQRNSISGPRT